VARGFESKSVADQQEAALSGPRRSGVDAEVDPVRALRRRTLELARADVMKRLETAEAPAHREMLQRALAAAEAELAKLG
jgi:hypothetical protein